MHRVRIVTVLALALAPVLAGCVSLEDLQPSALPVDVDVAELLPYLDLGDTHDHTSVDAHRAAWNVDALGWTSHAADGGKLGRYNHVQVHGDLAFVGAYALPPDMKPGMVIVDISDPADPTEVGRFTTDTLVMGETVASFAPIDVHLSEDGKFAALGGHRIDPAGRSTTVTGCTSPPAGPTLVLCQPFAPAGIVLVDVSDPTSPKDVGHWISGPSGAHTMKLHTIDGELYAFISSYGSYAANRMASGVEIVKHDPSVPRGFTPVSRFFPEETSGIREGGVRAFVHDVYVQEHPVTGERLLYVAYWDGGVVIANVDDPANPRQVAAWKDFDASEFGNLHYVEPMPVVLGGKHYTVAAPEYSSAEHAGETYVLDTTDPTAPKLLGKWQLPGNPVNPGGYMYSPHNFHLTPDGLMVLSHYHAGVWILDLNPVFSGEADAPTVLGYHFPVPPEGAKVETMVEGETVPNVWNSVWLPDGRIVASDIATGLYVLDPGNLQDPGVPPYEGRV